MHLKSHAQDVCTRDRLLYALQALTRAGTLQIWDHASGKLRKDLEYQAEEKFMMHNGAVLALNFSRDSELLVSGSQDGKIKVHLCWKPGMIQTGWERML